MTRIRYDMIY